MPNFSKHSEDQLATCHEDLQKIFYTVINFFDCRVMQGHRGQEEQDFYYANGDSQVKYPNSAHNSTPSMAADVAPWPIDWKGRENMTYLAGYVKGIAQIYYTAGVTTHLIRWGGDWDNDFQTKDNGFDDLIHFELYVPEK